MTRAKHPIISVIISIFIWLGLGLVIWQVPPSSWWVEVLVITLLFISFFLTTSWISKSWKKGGIISAMLVGLIIMRRLQTLDWLTGSLWILVMGLISFII